jgi:hypothetical protein
MSALKRMSGLMVRCRLAAPAGRAGPVGHLLAGWAERLGAPALAAWGAAWIETCADYHRAAFLYEDLRRRSDAALRSRGLSRATLAWEIAQTCDRASGATPQRVSPLARTSRWWTLQRREAGG